MQINIIGGGVVGLFTAWYLSETGHEVRVFDRNQFDRGTSFGNSGIIVPSHFVPLASPGVIAQGIRWMFSAKSPFFIRPRLDPALIAWLWRFYRSCDAEKAGVAMPVIRDLNLLSKQLYRAFADQTGNSMDLEEKGLLMLYQTEKKQKEELETAELAHRLGIETVVMDRNAVQAFETGTAVDALGGVHYPTDAHLYPNVLMRRLVELLPARGVTLIGGVEVERFEQENGRLTRLIAGGVDYPADLFVIAAGSWSGHLLKKLGVRLLLQDGKGYSVTLTRPAERPAYTSILVEPKVAVTPMGQDLRIGGTLELSNLRSGVDRRRLAGVLEAVPRFYPRLQAAMPPEEQVWVGYRPCSPDGVPYMGRLPQLPNVLVGTGHAMMGLSLGPAAGYLLAQLANGDTSFEHWDALRPERFS